MQRERFYTLTTFSFLSKGERLHNYRNISAANFTAGTSSFIAPFSYAGLKFNTRTVVSCVSLHAAFISESCQPEGSAVKVGKLIGVPWRFTAPAVSPFSFSPLSSILFDCFLTFRKVPALIQSAEQTIPLEFNDPVYSCESSPSKRKKKKKEMPLFD